MSLGSRTAAVILNHDDPLNTVRLVSQFKHYDALDRIVVVDNSKDKLKGLADGADGKLVYLPAENGGYAAGNNLGLRLIEQGGYDYVIISNPDVEVRLDAIEQCVRFLREHEGYAAAAPRMFRLNGEPHRLAGWRERTFLCDLAYSSGLLSRLIGMYRETYPAGYFDSPFSDVDCVAGSFFMIKSGFFKEMGYFDPHTFLYYEEDILGYKLKRAGYKSAVLNTCGFIHFEESSVGRSVGRVKKYLLMQKSRLYFQRHYRRINVGLYAVLLLATLLGLAEKSLKALFGK